MILHFNKILNRIVLPFNMNDLFLTNYIKSYQTMKAQLKCPKSRIKEPNKNVSQNLKETKSQAFYGQKVLKKELLFNKTPLFTDFDEKNVNRKNSKTKDTEKNEANISDFEDERLQDDSLYQFSEQIMLFNPKKESREQRQSNKLKHLYVFDWMMMTSATLKLTKQIFYRAIIIAKKFFYLEQKTPNPQVTLANVNSYGLGALLISSKFENIHGNFLSNKTWIGDEKGQLSKKYILECESYMLKILEYKITNKSFIIQVSLEIIYKWEALVIQADLQTLKLSKQIVNSGTFNSEIDELTLKMSKNTASTSNFSLLETFIYLIDYMVLRKMVEVKIKDFHLIQRIETYKIWISNVLYHLMYHCVGQEVLTIKSNLPKLKILYVQLVKNLNINSSQSKKCFRKSHILRKQIRQIFVNRNQKSEIIKKISLKNIKTAELYCKCVNFSEVCQKLTNPPKQDKDQLINQTASSKKEEKNKTNLAQILQSAQSEKKTRQVCLNCKQDKMLMQKLINQQFYLSLAAPSHPKI